MAPPGNNVDLKGAKKGKKSNSKDKRKHRKDTHERPAADEASLRTEARRKHKDEKQGKERVMKPKKDKMAEDDDKYSIGSDIAHYLMARHDDTPMVDKETHRLAVVNMDWDHVKDADDGGDGGEDDNNEDEDDVDDGVDGKDDSEHDSETENNGLRAYDLNRLRYYYAVVVCDSSATANHLYTTLDGTEFLKTANVFDLQFIPDSMEFKRTARDVATEAPPRYKESDFETGALRTDDDEPDRKKILRNKFKEDQIDDPVKFLPSEDSASDNDVDDSGNEFLPNGVAKRKLMYKERLALLLQGDESDEEQTDEGMEITFNIELEYLSKSILERKSTETKTVWEMHQEKMKEKRKARKRSSKDDDDYSDKDSADENDDFFEDGKAYEEVKPMKKQKVKANGKGKDKKLPLMGNRRYRVDWLYLHLTANGKQKVKANGKGQSRNRR